MTSKHTNHQHGLANVHILRIKSKLRFRVNKAKAADRRTERQEKQAKIIEQARAVL